jgi:hypothetical protein
MVLSGRLIPPSVSGVVLHLRVFGGVAIERSGVPITEMAQQHKAVALLALVAATGELGVRRDRLAAYLWPESDEQRARGALSQTLYTLRKQLSEPALLTGTQMLSLNRARWEVTCGISTRHSVGVTSRLRELLRGTISRRVFRCRGDRTGGLDHPERARLAQGVARAMESLAPHSGGARRPCRRRDLVAAALGARLRKHTRRGRN